MASHPVHGMLEQETRAGASLPSVAADTVALEQSGTITNDNLTGGVVQLKNKNFNSPFTVMSAVSSDHGFPGYFFRDVIIGSGMLGGSGGYSIYPPGVSATGIALQIDSTPTGNTVNGAVSNGGTTAMEITGDGAGGNYINIYKSLISLGEDSTVKNWVSMNWHATLPQFEIGVQWRTGGTQKDLAFCADAGVVKWRMAYSAGNHFLPETTNTQDIGSATKFVRNIFTAAINWLTRTAPASPVNGDMWFDGTALKIQIGGATKTVTVA